MTTRCAEFRPVPHPAPGQVNRELPRHARRHPLLRPRHPEAHPLHRARAPHPKPSQRLPPRRQPCRARPTPRSASQVLPRRLLLLAAGMETAGGFGELSSFGQGGTFQMIGDQAPLTLRQAASPAPGLPPPFPPGTPPPPPSPRQASAIVPSVRGFKIAENQSPQPQDRVFFTFDYFSDLNGALNRRFESPVDNLTGISLHLRL